MESPAGRRRRDQPGSSSARRTGVTVVVTLWILCVVRAARADEFRLHGEVGAEYDDNVHWAATNEGAGSAPRVGSPLARMVLGLAASDRIRTREDVAFSVLAAAKEFSAGQARSENVGVVETSGLWRIAVGDTRLSVNGNYFEAIQAGTAAERQLSGVARDFRSLSPTVRITHPLGTAGTLGLSAGYRWFVYKPLRVYDFNAPVLALEYRLARETSDGAADWEAVASGAVEFRTFAGTRLIADPACTTSPCMAISDTALGVHADQFFSGRIDVTRTGGVLLGAGYAVQWNRSNSYSETLFRHAGTLRVTTPLPLHLYLAARAELVYLRYPDRAVFPSGPSGQSRLTIEDENRSHLRAELSRDLTPHVQLIARYSLYINALGQTPYERQTGTLSLAFTLD